MKKWFHLKLTPAGFMKKNWKHITSLLFMILLIAATFHVLLRNIDPDTLKDCLKKSDWRWLFGTVLLVFIFIFSEGAAAKVICDALGHKISLKAGFVYASIDIYFSYITPSATGGQPLMIYYMSKDKIHLSKSGILVLMYTFFYSLSLVLIGIWAFIFYHSYIFSLNKGFILLYLVGMAVCLILMSFCLLAMFSQKLAKKVCSGLLNLFFRLHIIKDKEKKMTSMEQQLADYQKGAQFIREHPLVSLKAMGWVTLQRFSMLSTVYFVYRSFGMSGYSYPELFALQTFLTVASYVVPIPGAVGASEGMFLILFRNVFGLGLLMPGLLLSRGINFYFSLLLCAVVTIFNQFRLVKKVPVSHRASTDS